MPTRRPGEGKIDPTPGLAGVPGPAPPGVDDGTPDVRPAAPESGGPAPERGEAQREAGERAERSAGVRRADVPGLAGEREGRGPTGRAGAAKRRTRR